MAGTATTLRPIAELVTEYARRRGLSGSEIGRRIGRSQTAVCLVMNGVESGIRAWRRGDTPILRLIADELRIPDSKLRAAVADETMLMLSGD